MAEDFVFVDLETTGLCSESDRIIEIAAIHCNANGVETAHYQTLINPGVPVPEFITKLTGITTQDVTSAGVDAGTALAGLLEFVGSTPVVAFNADFDRSFLAAEAERLGTKSELPEFTCALRSARAAWPVFRKHNLHSLSLFFDLGPSSHRALEDCRSGAVIFSKSSNNIRHKKIVSTVDVDHLCISNFDIEAVHQCESGAQLKLWSTDSYPRVNAYCLGSIAGSGLAFSMEKCSNSYLIDRMSNENINALQLTKSKTNRWDVNLTCVAIK